MPETKKKKPAVRKTVKPRVKKDDGTIKVKRSRSKAASEHVLDLSDHLNLTTTPTGWAVDPYGKEETETSETIPTPSVSLFDDPVVRQTIDDKVGSSGRWPFAVYKRIAVTFVVLSLLSLAAVAYVTFVRLDINVVTKQQNVEASTSFNVYDRPESFELPSGSALGLVRNMEVEVTASAPVSGRKTTGAEVSGTVTIVNNYNKNQPLIATTRLLTPDNQILRLKESVNVPAGGQVLAQVYAAEVDPTFTLADARLTIPGLWAGLQDKIYAEVKRGDVAYKENAQGVIAQADIDEAARLGRDALLEKARADIDTAYATYPQKLFRLDESSVTVTPQNKIGDEASEAFVKVSGAVAVVAFNDEAVKNITNTALVAATPDHNTIANPTPAVYELVNIDTKENIAEVKAASSGMAAPKTDAEILDRSKLILLTRDQLDAYLRARPDIESYSVNFTPSFWPLTPQIEDKINVRISR